MLPLERQRSDTVTAAAHRSATGLPLCAVPSCVSEQNGGLPSDRPRGLKIACDRSGGPARSGAERRALNVERRPEEWGHSGASVEERVI